MRRHFQMFAHYNRWANGRVYDACGELSDEEYRADRRAFFGSAHRTLNHLLATDRIWMKRITGDGDAPSTLDAVLFEDFGALREARTEEDQRLIDFINGLGDEQISRSFTYTPISNPVQITQPLGPVLAHVFNHQTHHRGQVHSILTSLGKPSLVLDLIYFLRAEGQKWM
ncbi:DinB family protein [Neorhizobium sp. T786]|uniref:DinB family protein n=1 Tax=Pseudorhizobium xiangyangii TaxID=2883104 RepID=UPI001CFF6842|nr:DinB family protein [Neorhizobium xiangyangii]MCB5203324.1 DinB family protein [Neorhizobium xiangyangii]